jgi:putative methyltransferase (TIGR04325 family)
VNSSEIKAWIPPKLLPILRRIAGHSLRFTGGYNSWEDAESASSGYSHSDILKNVASATRKVVVGEVAYERDGFTFAEADYSFPLVSMLLHAALLNDGNLDVIDFGGSLGSTYRQCLPLLNSVARLRWQVIEQEHYVDLGKSEFSDGVLSFHKRLEDTVSTTGSRQVLLLSSVMQYLRQPQVEMRKLMSEKISHVLIDRTPIHDELGHRLCVQHVPANLNEGSYPCWIFSRQELVDLFSSPWRLLAEFPCLDGKWRTDNGLDFEYRGLCFTTD